MSAEIEGRYRRVREEMAREDVDALVVSGSEYTGFDGAVTYMSGFNIVHRYAYVLVPLEGDPAIVFPSEARYVGFHGAAWVDERASSTPPASWLRDRCAGASRVGVYGLDYVMNVRDYRALAGGDSRDRLVRRGLRPGPGRSRARRRWSPSGRR